MYLTSLRAQQIGNATNGRCLVLVEWTYGNQIPDVLELYYAPATTGRWLIVDQLPVKGSNDPIRKEITLPAPSVGTIYAAPRIFDSQRTLKDRQPDDEGIDRYWESFALGFRIALEGAPNPEENQRKCRVAPEITDIRPDVGVIKVFWNNPEGYNNFKVQWWNPPAGAQPFQASTKDKHFVLERALKGRTYAFRVAGRHEGLFDDCQSPWSEVREFTMPDDLGYGTPVFDAETSLTALSRDDDFMDIFTIGADGRVRSAWWDGDWHMWFTLGSTVFPAHSHLAALSRDTDFMDLFSVGFDGRVWMAWWNGNPWRDWTPLDGALFDPGVPVAALSRDTDFMDLFVVGRDQTLHSSWWNGNPWRPWFAMPGATFPSGTPVTALSRHSDHMEVFLVGQDGQVHGNWFDGQWHDWYILGGETFPLLTPIAAVSHDTDHMEIFAVGEDGVVRGNFWNGNWQGWFRLDGQDFEHRTPIAVLSRDPGHQEIFLVGRDGKVYHNWWTGNWSGWSHLISHIQDHPLFHPPIAALSRSTRSMDVFTIAQTPGQEFVWSDWWWLSWRNWFPLL